MKKMVKISVIMILLACIITTVYATIQANMNLIADKQMVKKGEKIVVQLQASDIKTQEGLIALSGILEYDKNLLSFVEMKAKENWTTPFYNEQNGKFIMDRNSFGKQAETVLEVTFEVKENVDQITNVIIKDIHISDGKEESVIPEAKYVVTIKKDSQENPIDNTITNNTITDNTVNNTVDNNVIQNQTNANQNEIENKQNEVLPGFLPQTGVSNILAIILIVAVIVCAGFYLRKKMIDRK